MSDNKLAKAKPKHTERSGVVNKVPQLLVSLTLEYLPIFCREKAYFLTLKSSSLRYQKMDTLYKMLIKISNNFIVTRESNKATAGYHFHALFRTKDYPKKSWFKKGVHIHIKEVGRRNGLLEYKCPKRYPPPLNTTPSIGEIITAPSREIERDLLLERARCLQKLYFEKGLREEARAEHALSVLKYIGKELTPISEYYKDFIIVIKKKHRVARLDLV